VDLAPINQWLSVVALVMGIGNGLYLWISRPAKDLGGRVDLANSRVDEAFDGLKAHDRRIQRVEDDMRHLPTKDDLHKVSADIASLKTEVDGIGRTVHRIDDFLRSKP